MLNAHTKTDYNISNNLMRKYSNIYKEDVNYTNYNDNGDSKPLNVIIEIDI